MVIVAAPGGGRTTNSDIAASHHNHRIIAARPHSDRQTRTHPAPTDDFRRLQLSCPDRAERASARDNLIVNAHRLQIGREMFGWLYRVSQPGVSSTPRP